MKQVGIYVHIPFCMKKCNYCDFISYSNKNNIIHEYIESVCLEIKEVANGIKKDIEEKKSEKIIVKTIYIGGGTPSYIECNEIFQILKNIFENFEVEETAEVTLEVNPGTVTKEKLQSYKLAGVNRISIGVQSANNDLLKMLGRIHTYEEFEKTYKIAREVGFKNINVDFIIGLPNQTIKDIDEIIEKTKMLQPNHISVYSLIVEKGTKIEKKIQNNELSLPDDSLEREMYWRVKNKLEELGYIHYEISNYAKRGYESKHNLDCWNQKEYIAFGAAAHSYTDNTRYSNIENIEEYIKNVKTNKFENNFIFHEKQDENSKMKEYIILGLRKIEGISISLFEMKFGKDIFNVFEKEIEKLLKNNLIEIEEDKIKLSNKGIDFANIVWEEFV